MKRREQARQIALQALYQLDVRREDLGPEIIEFLRESTKEPEVYFFARRLTEGVWAWREEADRLIGEAAEHWRPERMAVIDRLILRMAVFQLSYVPDVPPNVVINEAIELARRFGGEESGRFVNGVLDAVRRTLGLPESPRKVKDHEPRAEEKQGRSRSGGGAEKKRPGSGPGRKP